MIFVAAMSVATAIFLILEMDRPYEGVLQISAGGRRLIEPDVGYMIAPWSFRGLPADSPLKTSSNVQVLLLLRLRPMGVTLERFRIKPLP